MAEPAIQRTEQKQKSPLLEAQQKLDFSGRESKELIIGFSGAIGSGLEYVIPAVKRILEEQGYQVIHLKLSKVIEALLNKNQIANWNSQFDSLNRYERLQHAGNQLRSNFTADFLAEMAIAVISSLRIQSDQGHKDAGNDIKSIVPTRVAYLVDQLKHPDEVALLREVYGNLFYLVGVLTGEKHRHKNLAAKLPAVDVAAAMERDRHDEYEFGQQLDKTLKLADFFLRNNYQNTEAIEKPLRRFFNLIHGQTARTPTKAEYAMYAAFSAALRSACLSRQVGASITDESGNIISTGCNDVPKAHGGLYSEEDSPHDHRCIHMQGGVCFNDLYKSELSDKIAKLLKEKEVDSGISEVIIAEIRTKTRLRDLIEFSRSVHAEMDAIVSVARRGGESVAGGSLYSTTFPCHNCARHIVAAGITKVFYIEPYEKSLALELHSDAIVSEVEDEGSSKVQFLHFEGVAPRQYQELFFAKSERKNKGSAIPFSPRNARKRRVQYLDGYRDLESKVVKNLVDNGFDEAQIAELSAPIAPPQ